MRAFFARKGSIRGLLAVLALSGIALSQAPAGHGIATEPVALPGARAPLLGEFIVANSGLRVAELKRKLGKRSTVRSIAAGLEVSGVSAGHLAVTLHGLTETALQITSKGRQVRPEPLDPKTASALEQLNSAIVRYAMAANFGQPAIEGVGPSLGRARYPTDKCPVLECSPCAGAPQLAADCSALEQGKDKAYDAYMETAAHQELRQAVVSALGRTKFYGGVGGTIGDLVAAASLTIGSSSASTSARGLARVLVQMARDGVLEATLDGLGLLDLSTVVETDAKTKLTETEAARVAAGNALMQARKQWTQCATANGQDTTAQKRALIAYDGCRFRTYLGESPECRVREAACP